VDSGILFSIIGAIVTVGSILVAVGVLKGKLQCAIDVNESQTKQIDACATKEELAKAISHSDDLLQVMRERAEEDRRKGEGRYKELYSVLGMHGERISALEANKKTVTKALEDLRNDLNVGFRDVRNDIKEMRRQ